MNSQKIRTSSQHQQKIQASQYNNTSTQNLNTTSGQVLKKAEQVPEATVRVVTIEYLNPKNEVQVR